jgi:transcriptional regulator with XRE-family HTH domain
MIYFGARIKALRREKNLTQQQLADKIDLVKSSICSYEQSTKYPSIEVLIRLCRFFNVSSDYLLGLSDKMELEVAELTDEQLDIIMSMVAQLNRYNKISRILALATLAPLIKLNSILSPPAGSAVFLSSPVTLYTYCRIIV